MIVRSIYFVNIRLSLSILRQLLDQPIGIALQILHRDGQNYPLIIYEIILEILF
jgi:hypothetical protein